MTADRRILGENAIFSTDSNLTGVNNNVVVCGGSGSGKTMSISEPCMIETNNSSLIVTVTKRRIVNTYKREFMRRGYAVYDLNFINPSESDIAYDPLQYLNSYADITFLASSIVKANPQKDKSNADPYWDESAISLLSAEIAYILTVKRKPSFADVLSLHNSIDFEESGGQVGTSLDEKFEYLAAKDPNCFAVSCYKSFCRTPIKTASCIFSTLNTAIDTIFSPELRRMIAKERKVNFEDLGSRKTVLFVSTSAVNPALHCFVNMFYAQAFKSLFEYAETMPRGCLPIPVHVICDDFATGSKILNFPENISIFREKGISVTLLLQSESQLENLYGTNDATTIINNCDTYVYLGGMDLRTGRNVSERLNVPLDEILYMPIGQEIIFRRGQRPIVTSRYDILKDERYLNIRRRYERSD